MSDTHLVAFIRCSWLRNRTAREASTHDTLGSDAYLLHRILHGVPEGTVDIPPLHAFPIESNLDVMGGCSWSFVPCHLQVLTVYIRSGLSQRVLRRTRANSANVPHRRRPKTHPPRRPLDVVFGTSCSTQYLH